VRSLRPRLSATTGTVTTAKATAVVVTCVGVVAVHIVNQFVKQLPLQWRLTIQHSGRSSLRRGSDCRLHRFGDCPDTLIIPRLDQSTSARLVNCLTDQCRCPVTGRRVTTPFIAIEWYRYLQHYPDRGWASCLVHDIVYGVDIGNKGSRSRHSTHRGKPRNFVDTDEEHTAVTADITAEVALDHLAGPFASDSVPWTHFRCSPIKTVPKKGSASKFRVIHHLSYPHASSVNSQY
jgi:hypothetical protein